MSGCGCGTTSEVSPARTRAQRAVLGSVLAINVAIVLGEFGAGWWADSTALQADSLDSLGDAWVYALSLVVLARSVRARAGAALVKGALQLLFGVGVLVEVGYALIVGAEPLSRLMVIAATGALVGNSVCLVLLTRYRGDDINMRSVWLCSRNDVLGNLGVIAAAGLITATGWAWWDALVGAILATLFLRTGWDVLQTAWPQYRYGVEASRTCGT